MIFFQNSEWKSMFGSNESDSSTTSMSSKAKTLQKTAESLEKKLNTSQIASQTSSSSSGSFVTMSQSQVSSEGSIRSLTDKGSDKNPISKATSGKYLLVSWALKIDKIIFQTFINSFSSCLP